MRTETDTTFIESRESEHLVQPRRAVNSLLPLMAVALFLAGCEQGPAAPFHGYAEGEYVLVASPYAGQLEALNVSRGDQVEINMELFRLEQANEAAARQEAVERLHQAEARLENLRKGQRPEEIEALHAEAAQIEASRTLSRIQLDRVQQLIARKVVPQENLDEARTSLQRDEAALARIQAQLKLALQSVGRTEEIEAAQAEVGAADAVLKQAQWRLDQKTLRAPASGLVHDTFYVQGEWVPAGKPVVSLLPPGNIKLRFYVPETRVGDVMIGQPLEVSCDGCDAYITAKVSYVSSQAEYTPPVIFSRDERAKLVYLVEARPSSEYATRLKPGQPVDIRFAWIEEQNLGP